MARRKLERLVGRESAVSRAGLRAQPSPARVDHNAGGTSFHFVTDGIETALQRAKESAKAQDVRLGGGVATIQQYLRARLIDEIHLAITPTLLGSGEQFFAGLDTVALGYSCSEHIPTARATHIILTRNT